ncbi:nucleotidyltransferase domain-containing protein [Patescibacteria group bacterium]|nr:nucleotidyltransferase domain-containing protein [Patescibacteria group bacterium]MBU4512507.1 nucleotidyltransferase domain-containing protein [Patescibacteria group bacterium]MCG2693514.1 nucleotidyltransferase domain-containing protein [Candidatus Parcubacteria bacterium]
MSKTEAKKIVKNYAEKLKEQGYSFSAVYLFGSHVRDKANKWSDIDVAVVSDRLKRNIDKNRFLLWKMRRDIDTRIEPHGFTIKDFQDECDPMAYEIRKTGIKIA